MIRTHLWNASTQKPALDERTVRSAAVELARFGCNGAGGRWKGDAIFEEITEGRQASWVVNGKKRSYSGCGDLIHWTFWNLLGGDHYDGGSDASKRSRKQLKRWMNREEAFGWKQGWNIAKLRWKCKAWRSFVKGEFDPHPGDCLLIGEKGREHVAIVSELKDDSYVSYDYGQFNRSSGLHGGKMCERRFKKGRDGRIAAGNARFRPVIGVVDVWKIATLVQPTWPALVPDRFEGGVPSDNPYDPEDA